MSNQNLIIQTELEPGIVQLTLNDAPSRNAMSEEMGLQFFAAVQELKTDMSVRAVILTGAGKAFSGGGHLNMLEAKTKISSEENAELMMQFYTHFLSIYDLHVPVIAAINGHAVGAGLCLALACDVRIAVEEAKLGLNFVHLALHPGMGATWFLPRLVGPAHAAALLYQGKIVAAVEGEKLGLVSRVVSADALMPTALEIAQNIAAVGPQSVRELKESLRQSGHATLREQLQREALCQAADYAGPEFAEGITAAKEKRKPKF